MKELYIDFDGVILDTIPILNSEARKIIGQEIKNAELKENKYIKIFKNIDFSLILKDEYIINDSINSIKRLIESKKFSVNILTHICSLEEGSEKVKYIRRYFKDITIILVPKHISKTKMIHTEGAILVDDYAKNLREWEQEKGIGVRFSKKLNGKGFLVIDKLDQLLEMF